MTKKIQTFAKHSYVQGRLDEKTVTQIADHLNRRELKDYIRLLKQQHNRTSVIVVTPFPLQGAAKENISRLFPGNETEIKPA